MSDFNDLYSEKLWQVGRFKTFSKWPFKSDAKCFPSSMAEAGWYCTTDDLIDPSAKCAFCLKELSGWEKTDDPWNEHQKHSPGCTFIKLGKKEKDFSVADIHHLLEARMLKLVEQKYHKDLKNIEEMKEKILAKADEAVDLAEGSRSNSD